MNSILSRHGLVLFLMFFVSDFLSFFNSFSLSFTRPSSDTSVASHSFQENVQPFVVFEYR